MTLIRVEIALNKVISLIILFTDDNTILARFLCEGWQVNLLMTASLNTKKGVLKISLIEFTTTCVIGTYRHFVVSSNPVHGEVY